MLPFTCGESNIWSNIKMSQNIMAMIVCNFFFFFLIFMFLLAAPIIQNSHISARISLIFFRKRSCKALVQTCNTKFGPQLRDQNSSYQVRQVLAFFLQISCSTFRLKLC